MHQLFGHAVSNVIIVNCASGGMNVCYNLCMQDSSMNPAAGERVTFKIATNIAAARAAEKSAAPNRQYAGKLIQACQRF